MAEMELIFHVDPGHGWLQVPSKVIRDLHLQLTSYSYVSACGNYTYAEEDCDAGTVIRALRARGFDVLVKESLWEQRFPEMFNLLYIGTAEADHALGNAGALA